MIWTYAINTISLYTRSVRTTETYCFELLFLFVAKLNACDDWIFHTMTWFWNWCYHVNDLTCCFLLACYLKIHVMETACTLMMGVMSFLKSCYGHDICFILVMSLLKSCHVRFKNTCHVSWLLCACVFMIYVLYVFVCFLFLLALNPKLTATTLRSKLGRRLATLSFAWLKQLRWNWRITPKLRAVIHLAHLDTQNQARGQYVDTHNKARRLAKTL